MGGRKDADDRRSFVCVKWDDLPDNEEQYEAFPKEVKEVLVQGDDTGAYWPRVHITFKPHAFRGMDPS